MELKGEEMKRQNKGGLRNKRNKKRHLYFKDVTGGFLSQLLKITHPASVSCSCNVLSALFQRRTFMHAGELSNPSVPSTGHFSLLGLGETSAKRMAEKLPVLVYILNPMGDWKRGRTNIN